jgi:hypothetical protein
MYQLLYVDKYFHYDLHQGNIKYKVSDDTDQLIIYDFGLVAQLNDPICNLMKILAIEKPSQIFETLIASGFITDFPESKSPQLKLALNRLDQTFTNQSYDKYIDQFLIELGRLGVVINSTYFLLLMSVASRTSTSDDLFGYFLPNYTNTIAFRTSHLFVNGEKWTANIPAFAKVHQFFHNFNQKYNCQDQIEDYYGQYYRSLEQSEAN